jgi:thioredoxin-related protein
MNMKVFLIALLGILPVAKDNWLVDFEEAKKIARAEHKHILLYFSGSDWCGPCIQLRKEIFETQTFNKFAGKRLVLLNADFPRSKKHTLDKEQQKKNDHLAESYNTKGIFPLTILLTAEGKPIQSWEGLPPVSASDFVREIQNFVNAEK